MKHCLTFAWAAAFLGLVIFFMKTPSMAMGPTQGDDKGGAYERIGIPTSQELDDLQSFALKHGVDLDGILDEIPEDDLNAWGKVFSLSLKFDRLDRRAQIFGYKLFGAFVYYVQGCGADRFARLLDAQKPTVKQRVRDFLFYDAAAAPAEIRAHQEQKFRSIMGAVFPKAYSFGEDDDIFSALREKQ